MVASVSRGCRSARRGACRLAATALIVVLAVVALAPVAGAAAPRRTPVPTTDARVLVLSVPTLVWSDVQPDTMPNLSSLLAKGAVGDLSTRGSRHVMHAPESYATIGAGARAVGAVPSGNMFEPDEKYGSSTAGEVYQRRTGKAADGEVVAPEIASLIGRNEPLLFGAEVSSLGDALGAAQVHRAVVANADEPEPAAVASETQYGREAVSALMGSGGRLPGGDVGKDLLESDANSPYGVRLNLDRVQSSFTDNFTQRSVVLVEASDLLRADSYRSAVTEAHRAAVTAQAIRRTDALVGRLLQHVDLARDTVLVVSPTPSSRHNGLTVTGIVSPGVEPGLVTSATVRRSGFVQLVDVAPTILSLFGLKTPGEMEGRPYERDGTGGTYQERHRFLADADRAALFRDSLVAPATLVFVLGQVILCACTVLVVSRRLRNRPRADDRIRRALPWFALGLIGFLPMTYFAARVPLFRWGAPAYWAFTIGGAAVLAVLAKLLARRNRLDPIIGILGLSVLLLIGDVVFGDAKFQLNAVFGYSPTVAGRFAGFGNLAFATLASSTILLATLLAHRIGGRRGRMTAVVVCAVALVVDAFPMWGADVGGVLSGIPAYAIFLIMLFGIQIRWRTLLGLAVGTIAAVTVLGFIDLARPTDQRTHLGRFLEKIGTEGAGGFFTVIARKADSNISVLTTSIWTLMLPAVFLFVAYMIWRAPGSLRQVRQQIPEMRAGLVGVFVFGVLGFAVNDSGISIPGVMIGVVNSTLVFLVFLLWKLAPDPPPELRGGDRPLDAPDPVAAGVGTGAP
ncbi:MAG: hypothetical protein JWL73_2338 [Actinomycetia bacterium]|nr:hypothetical protein [Actinomycetes bacterium]